jgi:hypothetical protein
VAHALAVRSALAAADYPGFFRLYASAPAAGLGRALMDLAVPALRYDALKVLTKAFLPTLPVPFLAALLGFVAPPRRTTSGAPAAAKPTAPGSGRGAAGESDSVGGEASERSGDGGEVSAAGGGAPPAAAAAAAAAPGAAAGSSGSAGEPLPGCIEAHFEGEHAPQVGGRCHCRPSCPPACRSAAGCRPTLLLPPAHTCTNAVPVLPSPFGLHPCSSPPLPLHSRRSPAPAG